MLNIFYILSEKSLLFLEGEGSTHFLIGDMLPKKYIFTHSLREAAKMNYFLNGLPKKVLGFFFICLKVPTAINLEGGGLNGTAI